MGWLFANGLGRSLQFDADSRTTQISTGSVQNVSLGYSIDDSLHTQADATQPTVSATFDYDPNKRLKTLTRSGDNQSFAWDVDSNVTSNVKNGASNSFVYPAGSNRLSSVNGINIAYMTGGGDFYTWGVKSYTRDQFDRLSTFYINGNTQGSYRYNALDQRVYKSGTVGNFYYTYDPQGRLTSEINASTGAETDYIWLDGDLVALYRAGRIYYVLTDTTGRPQFVTDGSANVVWQAKNSPFDRQVLSDSIGGLNIGFAGQYYDPESGLYYNWHRYYDSSLGRYIESDPVAMAGGINTYTYAYGNPVSNFDPTGLSGAGGGGSAGHPQTCGCSRAGGLTQQQAGNILGKSMLTGGALGAVGGGTLGIGAGVAESSNLAAIGGLAVADAGATGAFAGIMVGSGVGALAGGVLIGGAYVAHKYGTGPLTSAKPSNPALIPKPTNCQ